MIKNKFQPKTPVKAISTVPLDHLTDYEQHGKLIYALIRKDLNNKYQVENERGDFLNLPLDRLHIYPENISPASLSTLKSFSVSIRQIASKIDLEKLWNRATNEKLILNFDDLILLSDEEHSLINYAALRSALILDKIYFKRERNGFSKKSEEDIKQAKTIVAANLKQESERLALSLAIKKILRGEKKSNLPDSISELVYIAALGKKAENAKVFTPLIDSICEEFKLCDHRTYLEDKALIILTKINFISQDYNLIPLRIGRPILFESKQREAAERAFQVFKQTSFDDRRKFEGLRVLTIDSDTTQDFDDALSLTESPTGFTVGIHITDVSETIETNSVLEEAAKRRATSIYCPDETFPMLPPTLSEGVLSLKEGSTRPCISFLINFNQEFKPIARSVERTLITVSKRLSYDEVDRSLDCDITLTDQQVINNLWAIAKQLESRRMSLGSTMFNRRDLAPEIDKNGKIRLVTNTDDTPARKLVSELMILANETAAIFASENSIPFLYRTQPAPECDIEQYAARVPEGPAREYARRSQLKRSEVQTKLDSHFSLGLNAYTQVTSPIRRYLDLILIRQLNIFLKNGSITYDNDSINSLKEEISPNLDEANVIQRERNRFWLLKYIEQLKIKTLEGTLVKIDGPRPLVELDNLTLIFSFMPDKKAGNFQSRLKLGDKIKLEITKLIPHKDKFYLQEINNTQENPEPMNETA